MGTFSVDMLDNIIVRCKLGESAAQAELYRRYAKNMYNVSFRVLGHSGEAEDALQDSFVEAFQKLGDYRGDSSFGAWLKRIVINKSISQLRKRRDVWLEEIVEEPVEQYDDFEFGEDEQVLVERVKKAIFSLPDGYRLVLSLYLLEGYDHAEIAEIMRISESTSKSQFMRAKNKLKELISKERIWL